MLVRRTYPLYETDIFYILSLKFSRFYVIFVSKHNKSKSECTLVVLYAQDKILVTSICANEPRAYVYIEYVRNEILHQALI